MQGVAGPRSAEVWSGFVASDPGLLRLRLAVRGVVAVGLAVAVEQVVGPALGLPSVVAMLLGGMVGLNGSFAASSRPPRDAALTLAAFPLIAGTGVLLAALGAGHTVVQRTGFVVVMVAAVFVRRWGPRGLAYGMIAWLAYFFTTFSGFRLSQVPAVLAVVVVATASAVLAAAVLVPDRRRATLTAARAAFEARVAGLAATACDVLAGRVPPERAAARLHAGSLRLVEVALIIDGYLGDEHADADGGPPAAAVRASLMRAELAATELASAVTRLHARAAVDPAVRAGLLSALEALAAGDLLFARARAARLSTLPALDAAGTDATTAARARDATSALQNLLDVLLRPQGGAPGHVREFQPAVQLFLGNLPGSASSVNDALTARSPRWSRWSPNTRLCVQTAVAAPIALLLGVQLSPQRYYWAVLACFLVLTGTLTTGEAATKGVNRVLGTVAGLVAATVAVHLTGGRSGPVVAVMLVCVFVGLYFFRVSYAVMAFAVTTLMGLLYEVLREFSDQLLGLRLAETALGAAVGVTVALLVLPVRTADARAAAQRAFLAELADLLADVSDRLDRHERTSDLFFDSRHLDAQLLQLALVSRPAGGPTLLGLSSRHAARSVRRWTEAAYRARALARAVAALEPGSRPDLAERCEQLRARLAAAADGTVPDPPPPAVAPSHEERSDETGGRLADLERAAETLLLSAPARR